MIKFLIAIILFIVASQTLAHEYREINSTKKPQYLLKGNGRSLFRLLEKKLKELTKIDCIL